MQEVVEVPEVGEENEEVVNEGENVEGEEEGARNNNVGPQNEVPDPIFMENNVNGLQNQRQRAERNNEDINWPLDWDRAGEELTWERLLGLDGSLMFLEHVFWVVSLNTLCILIFGKSRFCLYFYCLLYRSCQQYDQE